MAIIVFTAILIHMFIKVTRSGSHSYAQLTESFRDENGKPRQRTLLNLGRIDESNGALDSLLRGLMKVKGHPAVTESPQIEFESALALGDVWALDQLWRELGFDAMALEFRKFKYTNPIEQYLRVMVFNRLCDPESKLGVLRWLETVKIPGIADTSLITHQQLLRGMDALMDHQDVIDSVVTKLLRPLIDQEMSLVFYDLTTIRAAGLSELEGDIRKFGMSKEGLIARQFMLGVVQTADGLPIYHEVFDGNQSETKTLMPTLTKIIARYPHIKRLIVVADRGLLSLDNIEELEKLRVSETQALEFILTVPGRRYLEFTDLLQAFQDKVKDPQGETIDETRWNNLRLVIAHNPETAKEQTLARNTKISELEAKANEWVGKLGDQDAGSIKRGRKLSDSGAKARFYHEVCEAHLGKIIKVDLKSDLFAYTIEESALALAKMMDGKLLLVTNVKDLTAQEVVKRYKSLADIERGFRVLKSEIEIAPVYHRLPERIKAHAMLCFIALIIYRVMRQRLKMAKSALSPEKALAQLRRIQHHRVRINNEAPVSGISTVQETQAQVYEALNLKKPTQNAQMCLL